jgi:hypothetical protein
MDGQLYTLKKKVIQYQEILNATILFRKQWSDELKHNIIAQVAHMAGETGLEIKIETRTDIQNLEAIVISLGESKSGLYQKINEDVQRHLIKNNGALIFQQIFNGKIIVLINYPYIEGYGEPQPPKTLSIYRPEELTQPFLLRHLEDFVAEITRWEDYDDEEPNKRIGFNMNFTPPPLKEE